MFNVNHICYVSASLALNWMFSTEWKLEDERKKCQTDLCAQPFILLNNIHSCIHSFNISLPVVLHLLINIHSPWLIPPYIYPLFPSFFSPVLSVSLPLALLLESIDHWSAFKNIIYLLIIDALTSMIPVCFSASFPSSSMPPAPSPVFTFNINHSTVLELNEEIDNKWGRILAIFIARQNLTHFAVCIFTFSKQWRNLKASTHNFFFAEKITSVLENSFLVKRNIFTFLCN